MRASHREFFVYGLLVMVLLVTIWSSWAVAIPALNKPFTLVQPDGTQFVARQGGDEWRNWVSYQGKLIVQGRDSWWRYGQIVNQRLTSTPARAAVDPAPVGVATIGDISKLPRRLPDMPKEALRPFRKQPKAPDHALIILVEFSDRTLTYTSESDWSNWFFSSAGKTVRNYFYEASRTTLSFSQASETWNIAGDGVIRVNLGYAHPNPADTIDDRNRWIAYDAIGAADPYINFASFDTSPTDGVISANELHILTIVAGYERSYSAAWSPSVWGHRWALGFGAVPVQNLDGVVVGHYAWGGGYMQDGELHGAHRATIGVTCHEMGHDIGLIDLYDTDASSAGIGGHGLMGYGGWGQASGDSVEGMTPSHPCGWSKIQAGLISADTVASNGFQTLYATDSLAYNVLKILTSDANQYFLVENRQLSGFDAGLWAWFDTTSGGSSAGGLAIWHIDESISDNDTETHKKVDLEEANDSGYSELDNLVNLGNRHHYFYFEHRPNFGDNTTPNSRLYDNTPTNLDICAISSAGETMSCYLTVQQMGQLGWGTYLGHNEQDQAMDIAVDDSNYAYVVGYTASDTFPTTIGAYQTYNYNYTSAFVTKFNQDGSGLIYSTFLNGGSSDMGYGIAVDDSGYAYVTGYTYSSGFPTTVGAYDRTHNGDSDVFITKLNQDGSNLIYSTFLGGGDPGPDEGYAIAIDGSGKAYVTGYTYNTDFPTTSGAFDRVYNLGWDAFCTKLNATGSGLSYSTFLGGTNHEVGRAIAVDGSGYAYVTGWTQSSGYPTTVGAYDVSFYGMEDAFVTKVATNGASLAYSTFLGASGMERGLGIDVDGSNKAYVTGYTSSWDYPTTAGAYDQNISGVLDAFVTKFNSAGNALDYSTFLGGYYKEYARGIEVDGAGNAYVTGVTDSVSFPTTSNAVDTSHNGGLDIFQAKINAAGTDLLFSTYLGSSGTDGQLDWPPELAIDGEGDVYIASYTDSADFPVTAGAFDVSFNGGWRDAVVCKITMGFVDAVPPFAVDDLTARLRQPGKTSGDIQLIWTMPYDNVGVNHYVVYRDTLAGALGDSLGRCKGTSYIDAGAAGDTLVNYFYRVKAVDAAGNRSDGSNQVGEFDKRLMKAK
jgi:M6 family metalloprotease-like protein